MKEIKLSNRMKMVADMVHEDTVADIGCDHAFVSIYLRQNRNISRVFAMDVRKGPLEIARRNIALAGESDNIIVRMSNGLEKLEINEASCAILAGMGGMLIISILENAKKHIQNGISFVLQPQSDIIAVRNYVKEINYCIVEENMLFEEGKYYTAFRIVPDTSKEATEINEINRQFIKANGYDTEGAKAVFDAYGLNLIRNKNSCLKDYLYDSLETNMKIYSKLNDDSINSQNRKMQLEEEKKIALLALKMCE